MTKSALEELPDSQFPTSDCKVEKLHQPEIQPRAGEVHDCSCSGTIQTAGVTCSHSSVCVFGAANERPEIRQEGCV